MFGYGPERYPQAAHGLQACAEEAMKSRKAHNRKLTKELTKANLKSVRSEAQNPSRASSQEHISTQNGDDVGSSFLPVNSQAAPILQDQILLKEDLQKGNLQPSVDPLIPNADLVEVPTGYTLQPPPPISTSLPSTSLSTPCYGGVVNSSSACSTDLFEGILQMQEDRLTHGIASDANLKLLLQAAAMNLPRADSDVLALKAAEDAQGHNTTQDQVQTVSSCAVEDCSEILDCTQILPRRLSEEEESACSDSSEEMDGEDVASQVDDNDSDELSKVCSEEEKRVDESSGSYELVRSLQDQKDANGETSRSPVGKKASMSRLCERTDQLERKDTVIHKRMIDESTNQVDDGYSESTLKKLLQHNQECRCTLHDHMVATDTHRDSVAFDPSRSERRNPLCGAFYAEQGFDFVKLKQASDIVTLLVEKGHTYQSIERFLLKHTVTIFNSFTASGAPLFDGNQRRMLSETTAHQLLKRDAGNTLNDDDKKLCIDIVTCLREMREIVIKEVLGDDLRDHVFLPSIICNAAPDSEYLSRNQSAHIDYPVLGPQCPENLHVVIIHLEPTMLGLYRTGHKAVASYASSDDDLITNSVSKLGPGLSSSAFGKKFLHCGLCSLKKKKPRSSDY
ncbi:hypothetical protein CEUSTIGMA_g13659.t1 [Chlamydomonas eustigma]|uniref:Uncharacterized protein n=1 Tax=Chlamydomonas eustigma TaxID=1157962 RepID=A0A250XT51_9CHLO|nr:hypothetical protein CEUSTIGMA_g13659.t1 [Chlamydomonas eustigma]|eukprot:GAX86247.1 hypothetical protein CEUSTIGMA_g13659.t1 [Chlamydomonas eustigma]